MLWMPLLAAITIAAAPVPESPPAPAGTDAPESIDSGVDRSQRMTIPISVNGSGPFPFTIDTGADRSVVSDALAARLALPAGRKVMMTSVVGDHEVGTAQVRRLRFGGYEKRGLSAAVLPEQSLGATGFLGTDMLAGRTLVLDFGRRRVLVDKSAPLSAPTKVFESDPNTITVVGRSRFGQLILTDASINGVKVYAIIDTGAQNTIGNLKLRAMLLGNTPKKPATQLIGVAGGTIPCEAALVSRIKLGGMELANMPIGYADATTFHRFHIADVPAILIGMDVLRTFETVSVDFGRREVRFQIG